MFVVFSCHIHLITQFVLCCVHENVDTFDATMFWSWVVEERKKEIVWMSYVV